VCASTTSAAGMSPRTNTLLDLLLAPLLVPIGVVYRFMWDRILLRRRAELPDAEAYSPLRA
jgi:hypothetical protein